MNKVILVDGNNLLFRSFYATLYTGNLMKTSKGVYTNAIYGLVNMINKIIDEEKPKYIIVAFDKGKTFRHDKYEDYKAGRIAMPEELREQFPLAKEVLKAMGVHYYEIDNYEADDIIGTLCKEIDTDPNFIGTIVSSDKDLLQLISADVDIKLLKQKDYIRYNVASFVRDFGFEPIHMVDLKALQGDASDNIKGVKGIGEKTALKLIGEYHTIENLYEHIDDIKGSMHLKLKDGYEDALTSKDLCTIYKDVPLDISLSDLVYEGPDMHLLSHLYQELEFNSLLKKIENKTSDEQVKINVLDDIKDLTISDDYALYFEWDDKNYHKANLLGVGYADQNNTYVMSKELFMGNISLFKGNITTYNIKSLIVNNITIKFNDDIMLLGYLNNFVIKDDISALANEMGYDINPFHNKDSIDIINQNIALKAKFCFDAKATLINMLEQDKLIDLYYNMELPLTYVLAKMEQTGVVVDINVLDEIGLDLVKRLNELEQNIYETAGVEFNIASPKQLGVILFETLGIKGGKKTKTGYSTDKEVLHRLINEHPVINLLLEYRTLAKVNSTYVEGLKPYVINGKIHPIFSQVIARTGRLSCMEPNLQNIPIRNEEGRIIRKAFLPSKNNILMGCDYSQIELRIFAHLSNVDALREAFIMGRDIHTQTAMDIYNVLEHDVTKEMRRVAKAVNFGIIYGISGFGLSNNLEIDVKEAKAFIDKYLNTFPGVKKYMDEVISDAKITGSVKTLYGRIRTIDELNSKNFMVRSMGERMALNTPIQGTSADIIKMAMIKIDEEITKQHLSSKMIIQVHDELIFDVVKSEQEQLKTLVKDIMENIIKLNVPLEVSADFGDNWYDLK